MRSYKQHILSFLILILWCTTSWARTTGNGTTRNVNIDGVVTVGTSVGTNTADWELDEVFEGFNTIVNWHLSWDDDFVYIGKIGGNNAQGSLIYIRADQSTSSFVDSVDAVYDGFDPRFTNMNGINFVCYLKDNYHEYRTFDGTNWNMTANSLSPAFSDQGGINHMEIKIAWDDITGGNGKPDNMRIVFYQVEQSSGACGGNFFSYAESPWGTGTTDDGPSVGVNDGASTSDIQPGGCGTENAAITRWWGCYPVISGVSSNGWLATKPKAGPDDFICETEYDLDGNNPSAEAIGTWTVAQKPEGSMDPTFSDINNPDARVTDLEPGIYIFEWSINYGRCPSDPDSVALHVGAPIESAIEEIGPPDDAGLNGSVKITAPSGGFPPFQTSIDSVSFSSQLEYSGLNPGPYLFYIVDSLGCTRSMEFEILNVPTGFSPNGDGTNDEWILNGLDEFPTATYEIFSAWGQMVYNGSVQNGSASWDGNWNGNQAPEANYYYMIYFDDGTLLRGSITLIR